MPFGSGERWQSYPGNPERAQWTDGRADLLLVQTILPVIGRSGAME